MVVEPITLIGTIAGACLSLAACADRVHTMLKKVAAADVRISALTNEIQQLHGILGNLSSHLRESDRASDSMPPLDQSLFLPENGAWKSIRQILYHCQQSLKALEDIADKIGKSDGRLMRRAAITKSFAQYNVALSIRLEEISRYRQTLNIALTQATVYVLQFQNVMANRE
jgi:hypothetical protein